MDRKRPIIQKEKTKFYSMSFETVFEMFAFIFF
jgi:hypothetical protein